MKVNVRFSNREVRRLRDDLRRLQKDTIPGATARALNRAAEVMRSQIIREASGELKITQKRTRRKIRFQRRDRATKERQRSQVFLVTSKLPVSYMGSVRQLKKGAKVRGKLYAGAFKATMASGHVGVFYREGPKRHPIREVTEDIRIDLMGIADDAVRKVGEPEFRKRFKHELGRVLKEKK